MTRALHTRSTPDARTDRLPAVSTATAGPPPRRPRTLRLPRVRRVILRARPDQVAADMIDRVLRWPTADHAHVATYGARTITDAVLDGRRAHHRTRERAEAAATAALTHHSDRLRALAHRVDHAMGTATSRCARCAPTELCPRHQDLLWRWWDHRDTAAVAIVNATVAALTAPASARPHRRTR